MNTTTLFRYISVLEGVSLLVLLGIAMPLRYMLDLPMMVKIVGMFHGVLFVAYVLFALLFTIKAKLSFSELTWIVLLSVIPFGTFYADAKYLKRL